MNSKVILVARILLGLIFTVFGLNKLIGFMDPPPMDGPAGAFMGAMGATGYFFAFLGIVEAATGILLLIGKYTRLATIVLLPVTINIALFHLVLAPAGGVPGYLSLILNIVLVIAYKDDYEGLLK